MCAGGNGSEAVFDETSFAAGAAFAAAVVESGTNHPRKRHRLMASAVAALNTVPADAARVSAVGRSELVRREAALAVPWGAWPGSLDSRKRPRVASVPATEAVKYGAKSTLPAAAVAASGAAAAFDWMAAMPMAVRAPMAATGEPARAALRPPPEPVAAVAAPDDDSFALFECLGELDDDTRDFLAAKAALVAPTTDAMSLDALPVIPGSALPFMLGVGTRSLPVIPGSALPFMRGVGTRSLLLDLPRGADHSMSAVADSAAIAKAVMIVKGALFQSAMPLGGGGGAGPGPGARVVRRPAAGRGPQTAAAARKKMTDV